MDDSGILALVVLAQFHQIAVDPGRIRHEFGNPGTSFTPEDILRAAKAFGFRARKVDSSLDRLSSAILPAIGMDNQGKFFIIARVARDEQGALQKVLIQELAPPAVRSVSADELLSLWSGTMILLTPRGVFGFGTHRPFNLSWFIPSLVKYRRLFGEVVLASVFLQLFALVTPLFFQVVMDKVLVHKGLTTLDVLALGFIVISLFDSLLTGLRTYTFSHTTNRVDVELGSRLFHHLTGIPLAYHEARQVGQTVARVRELDTIRNFITGSSLTLVIDLTFTIIFFVVMWFYSHTLTIVVLCTIPFYVLLSLFITPIFRHRLDQRFRHGAANHAFLTEATVGIQTVKALALEPQMQRRWEDQLSKYVTSSFRAQNLGNVANQIAGFINKCTTLGIIWWGAHLVMASELTVGQLIAFNMIAGRVSGPILKLVQLWQDFQQAGISLERLGDILNTPKEPGYAANRSTLPQIRGLIRFDHVRFRYQPDRPLVIDDLSLDIKPGEVVIVDVKCPLNVEIKSPSKSEEVYPWRDEMNSGGAPMLKKEDWMDIREQLEKGFYQKDIANRLGVHPKTVSRALARQGAPLGVRPNAHKSKLDEFKPFVDELLREGVWNAKVILMECRERGYTGSYSVVRDYIHPKRPLRESKATVRYETEPGHQMQNDWGAVTVQVSGSSQKVHFTVNTLGYSRRFHFWCAQKEDAEHTYEGIIRAFEYFGGVPREVLVDNQKSLVIHHHIRDAVHFNERFLDLAGHYGFTPRACRPYRARTKGKDERMVGYIKGNFFVRYRRFDGFEHMNLLAQQWLKEEADQRIHGTVKEVVAQRFLREAPTLGALPAARYDTAYREQRMVHWDGYIDVQGNRYSVPSFLCGKQVTVRISLDGRLAVYAGDIKVADHVLRSAREGWGTVADHHHALWQHTFQVQRRDLSVYEEVGLCS